MSAAKILEVESEEAGLRLDRWFRRRFPQLAHGRLEKLLRTGQVRVDGGRAKAGLRLDAGQMVRVPPLDQVTGNAAAREAPSHANISRADRAMMQNAILHNDGVVMALNKPPGLAVQGGSRTVRHIDGMLDALRGESKERPRLVHRLDRDTSGVLLLACTANAAAKLARSFQGREARKIYWALTMGVPHPRQGRIRAPLAKVNMAGEGQDQERISVVDDGDARGKPAETVYKVMESVGRHVAWVAFLPLTGRTHQLRAHAALLGTPIAGDRKYGAEQPLPSGLAQKLHLHARSLEIPHPNGRILSVTAPLPQHMRETWKFFGFNPNLAEDPFAELDP
ncbi:MAG TPA: RluA family pseudouridine synthase [Alphaproteobacteria bacterium]|nr:RluA family pseudouridine synthase [Alphaproteobacteria bacterium]